jgi:ferredoxin-thioredoxin reductase catalytic subunit
LADDAILVLSDPEMMEYAAKCLAQKNKSYGMAKCGYRAYLAKSF